MTRKNIQWIAFVIAILPTFGLAMAIISGFHLSREDMRTILVIAYSLSIVMLLISLLFPKRIAKNRKGVT